MAWRATAWAWLPADMATTPHRRSSSRQGEELVERTALLERRGELEVLELHDDPGAEHLRQRVRPRARRALHRAGDPLRGGADVVDGDGQRAHSGPGSHDLGGCHGVPVGHGARAGTGGHGHDAVDRPARVGEIGIEAAPRVEVGRQRQVGERGDGTCQPAVEPIALAREKGWDVWGETCTQYLFVDESALEKPEWEGAKYIYTPPPRPKEHQEHLWKALVTDDLSVVSTDHCPFNWPEQKGINGREFEKVPNGGPGIENRLHMLHHLGVRGGRITLNRFVELTSTNVAKRFGLYPRKGTIAVGSDADVVVWDPDKQLTISASTHHSNVNYSLFEGTEVRGAPEVVFVRGQVIVENDELVADPGAGRFVKRARSGERLAAAGPQEAVPA